MFFATNLCERLQPTTWIFCPFEAFLEACTPCLGVLKIIEISPKWGKFEGCEFWVFLPKFEFLQFKKCPILLNLGIN